MWEGLFRDYRITQRPVRASVSGKSVRIPGGSPPFVDAEVASEAARSSGALAFNRCQVWRMCAQASLDSLPGWSGRLLLAYCGEELLGAAHLVLQHHRGFLNDILVSPKARGKGLGRAPGLLGA